MSESYDIDVRVEGHRGSISFETYAGEVSNEGVQDEALKEIADEMRRAYNAVFGDQDITKPKVHIRVLLRRVE